MNLRVLRFRKKSINFTAIAAVLLIVLGAADISAQISTPTPTPTPFGAPLPRATPDTMPVQGKIPVPNRPMPSTDRVGVDNANPLSLTMDQAIEMALKNSNDIDASRKDVQIADFTLRSSKGVYDPLFNSQSYYESRATPTASTIGGAVNGAINTKTLYNDLGLSGLVPKFGASYSALYVSTRTDSTSRNATLNPQFPTSLALTFTQPLWRNRSIDSYRHTIEINKKNLSISDSQLRQKAMDIVSSVEQAYWDLTFALRNLQVQIDTLKQAKDQQESNQRQVDKGALAPIDLVQASVQVATFEQNVFAAQQAVTTAENVLKVILLAGRVAPEWTQPLVPVTPVEIDVPKIGLEVATAAAMKDRPELEQLTLNDEANRIDQRYYRNQTKPQVDLVGSYSPAGLAGAPTVLSAGNNTVPQNLVGGYFNSVGNLFQQDFPTYRASLIVSLPIGNHVAKANLGLSIVQGGKIQNQRNQEELAIEADVRNALQAVRSDESRYNAAVDGRIAAQELYESQLRQFRDGTTTFYLVAQSQTDLNTAQGKEIQARTDLDKAISQLHRAMGDTLTVNNVTVTK